MREIYGNLLTTPYNPEKLKNNQTTEQIKSAVSEYLAGNPVTGEFLTKEDKTDLEKQIVNMAPYICMVYKVTCLEDVYSIYNKYGVTEFNIVNYGEPFSLDSGPAYTVEKGDVWSIIINDGAILNCESVASELSFVDTSGYFLNYAIDGTDANILVMNGGGATVEEVLAALPTWEGGSY